MSRPHVFWTDDNGKVREGKVDGYCSHEGKLCAIMRTASGSFPYVPIEKLNENDPRWQPIGIDR